MEYRKFSFRHAEEIFSVNDSFKHLWEEVLDVLDNITEQEIIAEFNSEKRAAKSISEAINKLIDEKMRQKNWNAQSRIFADNEYYGKKEKGTWKLDFAKETISVEVAFNHGGGVSWNLIKPVLASELNHVKKAIQTRAGIIIAATDEMKKAGGFDGAVGSYEKYVQYLKPLNNLLTVPMVIIGLEAPRTFYVHHYKNEHNKTVGEIKMINEE